MELKDKKHINILKKDDCTILVSITLVNGKISDHYEKEEIEEKVKIILDPNFITKCVIEPDIGLIIAAAKKYEDENKFEALKEFLERTRSISSYNIETNEYSKLRELEQDGYCSFFKEYSKDEINLLFRRIIGNKEFYNIDHLYYEVLKKYELLDFNKSYKILSVSLRQEMIEIKLDELERIVLPIYIFKKEENGNNCN